MTSTDTAALRAFARRLAVALEDRSVPDDAEAQRLIAEAVDWELIPDRCEFCGRRGPCLCDPVAEALAHDQAAADCAAERLERAADGRAL